MNTVGLQRFDQLVPLVDLMEIGFQRPLVVDRLQEVPRIVRAVGEPQTVLQEEQIVGRMRLVVDDVQAGHAFGLVGIGRADG